MNDLSNAAEAPKTNESDEYLLKMASIGRGEEPTADVAAGSVEPTPEPEKAAAPDEEPKAEPKADNKIKSDQEIGEYLKQAALDPNVLNAAINANGDILPEHYTALEALGLPKALIKEHVTLARSKIEAQTKDAVSHAGGEAAANAMMTWAALNLTTPEKAFYNQMLATQNYKVAIDALKGRMAAENPRSAEGRLISNVPQARPTPPVGYRFREEMQRDMASPQYYKDPAFREQVMAKMRHASW